MIEISAAASLPPSELLRLAVDIVTAFVSNNSIPAGELPRVVIAVHETLQSLCDVGVKPPIEVELIPAVSIKKSVTPDAIICLEDGKRFLSLKRHLRAAFGLTPAEYRSKWGLPVDYPMVAPAYAAQRSELAKRSGLGSWSARVKLAAASPAQSGIAKPKGHRRTKKAE